MQNKCLLVVTWLSLCCMWLKVNGGIAVKKILIKLKGGVWFV